MSIPKYISGSYFGSVINPIFTGEVVRATKYFSPKLVLRATRQLYGKRINKGDNKVTIVLTVGSPNYVEREFIKKCQKAKESFPVKKVQFRLYKKPSTRIK